MLRNKDNAHYPFSKAPMRAFIPDSPPATFQPAFAHLVAPSEDGRLAKVPIPASLRHRGEREAVVVHRILEQLMMAPERLRPALKRTRWGPTSIQVIYARHPPLIDPVHALFRPLSAESSKIAEWFSISMGWVSLDGRRIS